MNTFKIATFMSLTISLATMAHAEEKAAALPDAYPHFAAALESNDADELAKLLTDDFVLIDFEGKRDTKHSLLTAIRDGIIVVKQCTAGPTEFKELTEVGIAQGPVELQVTYGKSKPIEITGRFAITSVLVKTDGQWRLISAQMTRITPRQN